MSLHTINVPSERLHQLKALADASGGSIADAIGGLVKLAIDAKQLPDTLPGWRVERDGEEVVFQCPESDLWRRWDAATAREVADTLDGLAYPSGRAQAVYHFESGLQMLRKGNGLKITDAESKASRTVTPSIAADLSRLLRAAAH